MQGGRGLGGKGKARGWGVTNCGVHGIRNVKYAYGIITGTEYRICPGKVQISCFERTEECRRGTGG